MLVFDNDNKAQILDNVETPLDTSHFWVLDLTIMDFTLTPLLVLEEIICPTAEVMINGFKFNLPTLWNILVVDEESMQLDVVEVKKLPGKEFRALTFGPNQAVAEGVVIQTTNYFPSSVNIAPSLNKHQMLCHPIGPDVWINVSPSDTYNKYLKGAVAGDLI